MSFQAFYLYKVSLWKVFESGLETENWLFKFLL